MNVRLYRVEAHPASDKGHRLSYEIFERPEDADKLFNDLLSDDTVLASAGYPAVVVSWEEFVHGEWVLATAKTMDFERTG